MNTDAEWERWGREDPYFGVISNQKFRAQGLTEETKKEFFESGKGHVSHIMDVCRRRIDPNFSPKRILDFGCGTGRLVIPFSEVAENVVGLDVSDSMLKEAAKNCDDYSVQNVELLKSDDDLSALEDRFDLIHSFIVFQHISTARGKRIFTRLMSHLSSGGICAVQFTYSKRRFDKSNGIPTAGFRAKQLRKGVKRYFKNLLGIEFRNLEPEMQMNPYNLNELFYLIHSHGINSTFVEYTDHGGELGVTLYFQKP